MSLISSLAVYLRLWWAQMRYSIVREMMFQINFVLWIIVEVVWFTLNLIFIQVLYLQVDSVAGWSKWEMVLLVSTNTLVQQLFQTFLMINCMKLPELIRTGKLDFFLAQPAPTQFLVSTRQFELGSLISGGLAFLVCGVALAHLPERPSAGALLLFPLFVVCGVLIHYSLMFMLMSLCFWMTRAQGLVNAYYNAFQIARLPREAFSGLTRVIFTWALPLLLVANVPAHALLHGINGGDIALLLGVTALLLLLARAFFQLGLRRYGSASS